MQDLRTSSFGPYILSSVRGDQQAQRGYGDFDAVCAPKDGGREAVTRTLI